MNVLKAFEAFFGRQSSSEALSTETVFHKDIFFSRSNNLFTIFQKGLSVRRTDTNFPGGFIEQTCFLKRVYLFVEQPLLSHRTYTNFPRNPYLVLEHIRIFQEHLLFSHRTDINFPGASIFSPDRYSFSRKPYLVLEHIRFSRRPYLVLEHMAIFQEGTLSRTDITLIGLGSIIWVVLIKNLFL